jgi:thiazole synthase ThiGH ThiG subunit
MDQIYALLSTSTKDHFREDAIGVPSDASRALGPGTDVVFANIADARVENPPLRTKAMKLGVETVRLAYVAGRMLVSPIAQPWDSTRDVSVQTAS